MKKYTLFPVLFIAVLFAGCKSDDDLQVEPTTKMDVTFTGSYGAEPLQMLREYTYPDGKAIKFSQFDFYISNMVLLKKNDPETAITDLKEIEFINLTNSTEAEALAGQTLSMQNIPIGTYAGIRFGLGVSSDLNRTIPDDYGSNSPLKKAGHYSADWNSYIFSIMECFADLDNNGEVSEIDAEFLSYHIGTDDTYKVVTIFKDIELNEGTTGALKLNVDLSQAFDVVLPEFDVNSDGYLDIETFTSTHSIDQIEITKKILDNLGKSFSVE